MNDFIVSELLIFTAECSSAVFRGKVSIVTSRSCSINTTKRNESECKDNGEDNENISQRTSCKWFRSTLTLTSMGLFYKDVGIYLEVSLSL